MTTKAAQRERIRERRVQVAALLLARVPLREIPRRLDVTAATVRRDVLELRARILEAGPAGPVAEATGATLDALDGMGRLETVDAARVQALRTIAETLDADPYQPQMWREYREALERLTDDGDDGSIDELTRRLSGTAVPVRDPEAG